MENEGVHRPHLGTFSNSADLSSFNGEAKTLGVAQAAGSQRSLALEASLGKPLFRTRGQGDRWTLDRFQAKDV